MYLIAPKMYILAPKMCMLGPKMDILAPKMDILKPKMDKFTFWKGTAPVTAFVPFFLRVYGWIYSSQKSDKAKKYPDALLFRVRIWSVHTIDSLLSYEAMGEDLWICSESDMTNVRPDYLHTI